MPFSDSMFLFEGVVDSLESFIDSKDFIIKCHLPNYFTFTLKGRREIPKQSESKARTSNKSKSKRGITRKQSGQAIIVADGDDLLTHLSHHKLELSLWSPTAPETKLGASPLPWSQVILNFLKQWRFEPPPAKITHHYYIYDDSMITRIAVVKFTLKLARLNIKAIQANLKYCKRFSKIQYIPYSQETNDSALKKESKDYKNSTQNFEQINKDNESHELKNKENEDKLNFFDISHVARDLCDDTVVEHKLTDKNSVLNSRSSLLITPVNNLIVPFRSKSYSSLTKKSRFTTLKHVFGDYRGPYGDKVYYVGYVTVTNDTDAKSKSESTKEASPISTTPATSSPKDDTNTIVSKCSASNLEDLILSDCKDVSCENKCYRQLRDTSDQPILLDITTIKKEVCCVTGAIDSDEDPCFCTCECTFGFAKKTTYCGICGGYERAGDEFRDIPAGELPFPCPFYHKLVDKNKLRPIASVNSSQYESRGSSNKGKGSKGSSKTSQRGSRGSDKSKSVPQDVDKSKKRRESRKSSVTPALSKKDDSKKIGSGPTSVGGGKPDIESEKDVRKNKKKPDNKFKFNYGYQAPKIGHAHCFDPCSGSLKPVPNGMGWLWTANNIPGLKYRPHWRPGATHKHVVKLLKQAKNPGEIIGKKKKKDKQLTKKKRPLKRPLLVVNKKDGEFTITMEHMKEYGGPKLRSVHQPPFEDKAPITFKIGRTEEENMQRMKKKLREQRRLERAQRMFIQNTFQDLCHEICLKTYQQAIGILPDAEKPDCPCYPALPDPERTDINVSCSCSEDSTDLSDTDSDEWLMEFTPPNCLFKQSTQTTTKKQTKTENESQYTYLDYRVKILDKAGNEIPRFFIGPNGKQICSDLGGFRGPDGKWLQINIDGFIGPDGRWAPHSFIGPDGENIETEDGKFTGRNGETLTIGVDGYIVNGMWKFYPKSKTASVKRKEKDTNKGKESKEKENKDKEIKEKESKGKDKNHAKDYKGKDSKEKETKTKENKDKNGKTKDTKNKKEREKEKDGKDIDKHKTNLKLKDKQAFADNSSQCDFSCFGTTSPRVLSEMGIRGHGHDRKLLLATLQKMLSKGIKVKIPEDPACRHTAKSGKLKKYHTRHANWDYYAERDKCRHPEPSPKGVLCCDELGRKTYFKIREHKNPRPKQRLADLLAQGKSLSSFHIPCFDSFLNKGKLRQQLHHRACRHQYNPESGNQYKFVVN